MARGFLSSVCSAISGGNIYRKNSFLVDQLNEKVAHENLNLVDDLSFQEIRKSVF